MSARDERIIQGSERVKTLVRSLSIDTEDISRLKQRQRYLIQELLSVGLSSRFIGKISKMSHQTVLSIKKKETP